MKRFYCTKCKRVKRVQKFPILINDAFATLPQDRVGECNWHNEPKREKVIQFPAIKQVAVAADSKKKKAR